MELRDIPPAEKKMGALVGYVHECGEKEFKGTIQFNTRQTEKVDFQFSKPNPLHSQEAF